MTVYSTPPYLEKIKDALRHSGHKLPTPSHLKVSTIKVSGRIVAAPKLVGEKVVAAPVVTEEAAAALSPQRKQSRVAAQSTQRAARMQHRQQRAARMQHRQRVQHPPRPTTRKARKAARSKFFRFFFCSSFFTTIPEGNSLRERTLLCMQGKIFNQGLVEY